MPRSGADRRLRACRARAGRHGDPLLRLRRRLRAAARAARRAARGGEPAGWSITTGGLQGFVFYAAEQLARRPGRVLVEGPTYDRPLKILAREGAEVVALAMDDEGLDPDALERELGRGGDVSFLYTIPTFQNPSGRTLSLERRRRIVELAQANDLPRARGRPVRPRPLRGRGAAEPARARRRAARHLHLLLLEDGRARCPRRLVRAARGGRGRLRGARRLDVHLAAASDAGRPSTS